MKLVDLPTLLADLESWLPKGPASRGVERGSVQPLKQGQVAADTHTQTKPSHPCWSKPLLHYLQRPRDRCTERFDVVLTRARPHSHRDPMLPE